MKWRMLLLFLPLSALMSASALATERVPPLCAQPEPTGPCAVHNVTIAELIANPDEYDGKRVEVVGYLILRFEGNAIYPDRETYERGQHKSGLSVNIPPELRDTKRCAGKQRVRLEGAFSARMRGHMGQWSGTITRAWRCESVADLAR